MSPTKKITTPDDPALQELCDQLAGMAKQLDAPNAWPREQLDLCASYGVFEWFIDRELGGQGWNNTDITRGYLRLSAACLTTTFIITQRMGACRRIAIADQNEALRQQLLPDLICGKTFSTVGISHLTTSRRHLAKPVMHAEEVDGGFVLNGFSPWVTGAPHADIVVVGATLDDERQILAVLPTDLPGVSVPPTADLVGLSASQTGPVNCENVRLESSQLLAGPVENVMQQGTGAKTGGLQTSTLAIGLCDAAITFIEGETEKRPDLNTPAEAMRKEWQALHDDLLGKAGGSEVCSNEQLRTRANSLALRSSQAALAAAKGTGYVVGHPAGRWCREALFFLVWSCPQPVMNANLCELAGIAV